MTKLFLSSLSLAALVASAPVRAEEYYFRGALEVASLGICALGPGDCWSNHFVDAAIERACNSPSREPIKVAGHSLGAAAALRFTWEAAKCGRKVSKVVFLDPLTVAYDMPPGTRWRAYCTPGFRVNCDMENGDEAVFNLHAFQTFSPELLRKARGFLNGGK